MHGFHNQRRTETPVSSVPSCGVATLRPLGSTAVQGSKSGQALECGSKICGVPEAPGPLEIFEGQEEYIGVWIAVAMHREPELESTTGAIARAPLCASLQSPDWMDPVDVKKPWALALAG